MNNDSGTRTETPEEIVEHISRLMSEAEAMLEGPVSAHAGEKVDRLRAQLETLQSKLTQAYGVARDKAVAGARTTDLAVREHPYTTAVVALGVGVLLGALLCRRK